ncbi:hypothetical protein AALP_AA2G074800 [Arabis alpina]|uniref:Uncharacterized protein n=1 Tax=Arabis alpina TaxID=50452 RepID=A0A087HFW7_ARAAL|nr:hypothetical protein AALP_AA2G074800 [Arabis alpina]
MNPKGNGLALDFGADGLGSSGVEISVTASNLVGPRPDDADFGLVSLDDQTFDEQGADDVILGAIDTDEHSLGGQGPNEVILGAVNPDDLSLDGRRPGDLTLRGRRPDDLSLVGRRPDDVAIGVNIVGHRCDIIGPETTRPDAFNCREPDATNDQDAGNAMIRRRETDDLDVDYGTDAPRFLDDESPNLPPGDVYASSSSYSSDSRVSSDEDDDDDMSVEVERTKKVKKVRKKAKSKVSPDPPGSSLSNTKSLRRLRKSCGIAEEIELLVPTSADRADAPPAGYMTLFENFFDQCLLWFPLPRFLMRFLAVNGVCLAQINPRGIRHLLGIYMLSRERGVDISTENLSYLTDFGTRGLSDELKHSVTNSSGMALIAGFPSKDDHFEYRFFFAEISERTVEADCINLVRTRWERRVKPAMPKVSKEFLAAMHKELSFGNGNWRRSFSRKRIERALSAEILPRKVLGRGQARLSLREQIALEAAAKARGSSGTGAPGVAMPTTSTPPAPLMRARTSRLSAPKTALPPPSLDDVAEFRRLSAERARIFSGKGKGVDRVTPSKRQRADAFPAAAIGGEASLFLLFDRLVGDYDEDVRSRGSELSAPKEANAALQSRLNETVERNEALERDAHALQRVKKDYEDKLSKLKWRCAKAEGETVRLRGELSFASDLQRARVDAAVAEARDEMTRSFVVRTSEVAGLLAEIGGKVQNDMLNLTEIDGNLEFIGLLQGSDPPDLPTEVETLRQRRHPIYDAHDVFADLLAGVRRVLEIPTAPAGAVETSAAVDDDVELLDEDDVRRQATRALMTDLTCLVFQT